ncbi:MAG TPA: DUF4097 family beta strand repeat-containing protein [Pyrinomonadaceae bacterium]|jgi:DUF4097 and DUF4098 domain-containing protein YvlB
MLRFLGRSVLVAALLATAGLAALPQKTDKVDKIDKIKSKDGSLTCRDEQRWYNDRLVGNCEIREQTLSPSGALSIDGRQNGGVSVKGWDQNQVLVRARVQTGAPTEAEAADLAKQVRIETSGSKIFASGPEGRENYHWDVSYEVFVPRRSDVSIETHNGGIAIADVSGKIDFEATNGGVVLKRVGGAVRGSTTNGGLMIELTGDRWEGETLDVSTTNGGVNMSVPENYSAHLETGTVNGGLSVDFPVPMERRTKELAVNLGSGGATIKATTTNGGVHIRRATANE